MDTRFFVGDQVLSRIFFLYGHTDDAFALPEVHFNNFELLLESHLIGLGYELVLFYNGVSRLYCYSEEMARRRHAWFDEQRPQMEQPASGQAAAFNRLRAKRRSDDTDTLKRHLDIGDGDIPSFFDRVMRSKHRCCIVFSDGWDLMDHTDQAALRTLVYRMRGWYGLPVGNENIAIVLFGSLDFERISGKLRQQAGWSFLSRKILEGNGYTDAVKRVGSPGMDEIERLLWTSGSSYALADKPTRESLCRSAQRLVMERGGGLKALSFFLSQGADWQDRLLKSYGEDDEDALETLRTQLGWENAYTGITRMIESARVSREAARKAAAMKEAEAPAPSEQVARAARASAVRRLTERQADPGTDTSLAIMLTGNPGTGKTEIAKLIGRVFRQAGLLSSGHLVKATRESLVGEYIGHTAVKTRQKLDEAEDGVLFVDEAYSLYRKGNDARDFGLEAIETILERMTSSKGRIAVVMAGYPEEMDTLLDANPGLRSRFGHNVLRIDDYGPGLLQYIFEKRVFKRGASFAPELGAWQPEEIRQQTVRSLDESAGALDTPLKIFFHNWHLDRDRRSFGNARACEDLAEQTLGACRMRVGQDAPLALSQADFSDAAQKLFVKRAPTLSDVMRSLDRIVGQREVKRLLAEICTHLKMTRAREERQNARFPGRTFQVAPGHYLFVGAPGSGKTTIVAKLAEALSALGIIGKYKPLRMTGLQLINDLNVGGVAQVEQDIQKAVGGVLFIDEAHQLIHNGERVIQLLLDPMIQQKNELCVVFGCYAKDEAAFLTLDEGLKSRISRVIRFSDYSAEEIWQIFKILCEDAGFGFEATLEPRAMAWFERLIRRGEAENGRSAEKLLAGLQVESSLRLDAGEDGGDASDAGDSGGDASGAGDSGGDASDAGDSGEADAGDSGGDASDAGDSGEADADALFLLTCADMDAFERKAGVMSAGYDAP